MSQKVRIIGVPMDLARAAAVWIWAPRAAWRRLAGRHQEVGTHCRGHRQLEVKQPERLPWRKARKISSRDYGNCQDICKTVENPGRRIHSARYSGDHFHRGWRAAGVASHFRKEREKLATSGSTRTRHEYAGLVFLRQRARDAARGDYGLRREELVNLGGFNPKASQETS